MGMADDMRNLAQEIPASYDARMVWVANMKRETADLMGQIQARQRERNREVAEMLRGFQRDHREMATALRRSLAEAESQRKGDFKAMFGGIQQRVAALRRETSDLLAGFQREREAMASHWQNLTATMARKRAAIIMPPKVPEVVEVAPPEVVEEVAPPEVVEEVSMEEQVLRVITDHPSGIKLTGIAEILDVEWRTLIPVVRRLMEEEKIDKVGDLYYLPGLGEKEGS